MLVVIPANRETKGNVWQNVKDLNEKPLIQCVMEVASKSVPANLIIFFTEKFRNYRIIENLD